MAGSIEWLAGEKLAAAHRFSAGEDAWRLDPEAWKYTRIKDFLPSSAAHEPVLTHAGGAHRAGHFACLDTQRQALVKAHLERAAHPLADLNLARLDEGHLVCVPAGERKRVLLDLASGQSDAGYQRIILYAQANSHIECVETSASGQSMRNLVIQVRLEPGASITHYRASSRAQCAWTLIEARIERDANYTLSELVFGAPRERVECRLDLVGTGASVNTRHLLLGQASERSDLQLSVRHAAAQTKSNHMLRTIASERAQLTLRGRVLIDRECPGSDAELGIRNLVLGTDSRINAKPELEIYTDDVRCSHGATFAELDAEQLFYLASRGIPHDKASTLLLEAFARDCLLPGQDASEEALPTLDSLNQAAHVRIAELASRLGEERVSA